MHFNRIFFFQEVLKCQTVYYGEIIAHFLRNVHHKTCVAVFIISRKIGGLLRSLSVGTLICGASLIKHLLFISSFTPLYNSARKGQLAFLEAKFGQALFVSKLSKLNSGKE